MNRCPLTIKICRMSRTKNTISVNIGMVNFGEELKLWRLERKIFQSKSKCKFASFKWGLFRTDQDNIPNCITLNNIDSIAPSIKKWLLGLEKVQFLSQPCLRPLANRMVDSVFGWLRIIQKPLIRPDLFHWMVLLCWIFF